MVTFAKRMVTFAKHFIISHLGYDRIQNNHQLSFRSYFWTHNKKRSV